MRRLGAKQSHHQKEVSLSLSLSFPPIYILPASFFVAFIFLAFFYFVYKISLLRGLKFTESRRSLNLVRQQPRGG